MRTDIPITDVQVGDTIVEGSRRIEVRQIAHNACAKGGSHVNRDYCYDRIALVDLKE
jgi:hypothetical protein